MNVEALRQNEGRNIEEKLLSRRKDCSGYRGGGDLKFDYYAWLELVPSR
jgi:hypothetical protein